MNDNKHTGSNDGMERLTEQELDDVLGGVGNTNLPLHDEKYEPHNMIKWRQGRKSEK